MSRHEKRQNINYRRMQTLFINKGNNIFTQQSIFFLCFSNNSQMHLFLIFLRLFIAANFLLQKCLSANILFTTFHDTGSHFGSMRPFMEMLAKKGHSVNYLDTIGIPNIPPSIHSILAPLPRLVISPVYWQNRNTAVKLIGPYGIMDKKAGILLENRSMTVVGLINRDWDFIVIDHLFWSFGFALATFKHRHWEMNGRRGNEPKIVIYSTSAMTLMSAESIRSVGRNWVSRVPLYFYEPTNSGDAYSPGKFTHRIFAFFEVFVECLTMEFVTPLMMPNIAKFGVPNFSWHELYSRTSLEFSDSIDRIGWPLSIGNEMGYLGAHCKKPKTTMPKEFADFIENTNSKGTIFIAFGTHVNWNGAPGHVRDALFGAFGRLGEFRIIFVYNGPAPAKLAKNVLLTKWAPQLEILAHPKTRAFISHGGNKSVREGLCAGVPLILMPILSEQAHSAHLLLAMGISPVLNKFTLTEEGVFGTISQVLSEPGSGARARKLQSMFVDRPMPALEEGVFRVERLAGKGGRRWRQFTQRRGTRLDWPQFAYFHHILVLAAFCAFLSWK